MKKLVKWMQLHPVLSVAFASGFSTVATCMAFREDWMACGAAVFAAMLVVLGFTICRSKVVPLLVILALAIQGVQAQEGEEEPETAAAPAAGCAAAAVAVVVVCVGGYCIYKIVKFCQRKFPKNQAGVATNAPPGLMLSIDSKSGDEDVYAASWNFDYMGSCYQYDPCYGDDGYYSLTGPVHISGGTTSLDITMNVDDEGEVSFATSITITNGPQATQNWEEFQDEVRSYGVLVTGNGDQTQFFARNGIPIPSNESPIQFNAQERRVQVHGAGDTAFYTVVVERSDDLLRWDHLLSTEIQPGARFRIDDGVNKGRGFYRMRATLTD